MFEGFFTEKDLKRHFVQFLFTNHYVSKLRFYTFEVKSTQFSIIIRKCVILCTAFREKLLSFATGMMRG